MAPEPYVGLVVRKLADKSGPRPTHPETGEPEPWPLAGLRVEGDPPKRAIVPTSFVTTGVVEGWLETKGGTPVHRPGGPPENVWALTHSFIHYDSITLKAEGGDVTYRVVHQPDKYVDSENPKDKVTDKVYADGETRVDWFYLLELEG